MKRKTLPSFLLALLLAAIVLNVLKPAFAVPNNSVVTNQKENDPLQVEAAKSQHGEASPPKIIGGEVLPAELDDGKASAVMPQKKPHFFVPSMLRSNPRVVLGVLSASLVASLLLFLSLKKPFTDGSPTETKQDPTKPVSTTDQTEEGVIPSQTSQQQQQQADGSKEDEQRPAAAQPARQRSVVGTAFQSLAIALAVATGTTYVAPESDLTAQICLVAFTTFMTLIGGLGDDEDVQSQGLEQQVEDLQQAVDEANETEDEVSEDKENQ